MNECGRQESNLRRPAFQAGALPSELRPRGVGGRGWIRTSCLLFVRQALIPMSYAPSCDWDTQGGSRTLTGVAHGALDAARLPFRHLDLIPGQGVEPRPPRSERGVLPVRRSRIVRLRPTREGSTQTHFLSAVLGSRRTPYVHATRLPFDPGSPAASVHVCGAASSWRGFGAGASRVR